MGTPKMTLQELNRATLARQMLLVREKVSPLRAIERLAGLQAQEAKPPFLGLWSRLVGFRREAMTRLIANRKLVRATMMRGTLHLMSAKDYLAFRGPMQPALSRGMQSILRQRAAGLNIDKLAAATRKFLGVGAHTFEEIRAHLGKSAPKADVRAMGFAIRTHLPLVQVPTDDAPWAYPRTTDFALAESWLDASIDLTDENVTKLVKRYLAAFGPATPADAQTWSALAGLAEVFEELRPRLKIFEDDRGRELFDLPRAPRPAGKTPAPVRLIPEFDNLVLAHADRRRLMADEHRKKICTPNLRVLPTFLVDGVVTGLWKIERTKTKATLVFRPFGRLTKPVQAELTAEANALLGFAETDLATHAVRFVRP